MRRHWQYLKYVLRHKWFVFKACLQLGVPLWIAILHDWDKFLPDEWLPYARTFYAPDGTKQYVESVDFARAWMKHQHRNKHHWQYWCNIQITDTTQVLWDTNILIWDRGTAQEIVLRGDPQPHYELRDIKYNRITCHPMPDVYRREMLADWRGAGQALGFPDTAAWYAKNKDNIKLHQDTREWLEEELSYSPAFQGF